MKASALYKLPVSNLHAEGLGALFHGKENVTEGIFRKLEAVFPHASLAVRHDNAHEGSCTDFTISPWSIPSY